MSKKVNEKCFNKECKNCSECNYSNKCSTELKNRKTYIDWLFNISIKKK